MAQTRTDMFVTPRAASGDQDAGKAGTLKLSNYLGILATDPDDDSAQAGIAELVASGDTKRLGDDPVRLIEIARQGHEQRGEPGAVAVLLEAEIALLPNDPQMQRSLLKELGRVRAEMLLQPDSAREAFERAREIEDDREVSEALKRLEQANSSWRQFAKRFVEEADSATDLALKTSLLVRAASLVWQYKKKGRNKECDKLLSTVLKLDPGHVRAVQLYEQTLRQRGNWSETAALLRRSADEVRESRDRINLFVRAARIFARKLGDRHKAAACYERVMELDPASGEGMDFLSQYFTEGEKWAELAGLYEDALRVRQKLEVEQALLLQISMVHWKMLGRPEAAEPYFARLRKLEPAHLAVIEFYREFCQEEGRGEVLLDALTDAQRVTQDPELKRTLAVEIAQRAQELPGMTERSIDAWKMVLRVDPGHAEASAILKDLYAKSSKWNALVEVLRNEIDAVPDGEVERKVELLRELSTIYRDYLRMDGMVINTFNAILKLLPGDVKTLNELAERYRAMGRWHDLITVLSQEADSQSDAARRVEMYLEVAQLWVEHFSNYNQAAQALEKVLELQPENLSALSQLKEIYEKKRAWKSLFEVLRKEREVASDPAVRAHNAAAMARLAAERLHRHDDAIALWKEVVAENPAEPGALEALERIAERNQDWATLAEVLEAELAQQEDDQGRVRTLQKLGVLYADRLTDLDKAKAAWRRVLAIDVRHGRALRSLRDALLADGDWDGLEALYAELSDWEGLVDVLGSEADKAEDASLKVDLSFRAARVYGQSIGEPQRALRSYERVLSVDPDNQVAAQAVLPLYEREEKWSRMVGAYECLLKGVDGDDVDGKLALLGKLVELCGQRMRDGASAYGYAARAYLLAPGDEAVIDQLETAAASAAAYDQLMALYLDRAASIDPEAAVPLRRRAAAIAAERLGQTDVAAAQLREILAVAPGDLETLASLEALERAAQSLDGVRDVLLRRLEHGGEDIDRFGALRELAEIEEQHRGDLEAAAACYRKLAELDGSDREVLAALDRLALAAGRDEELSSVLARRLEVETEPALQIELNMRLGRLFLGALSDPDGALSAFASVLDHSPGHAPAIEALEGMLADAEAPERRAQILSALERAYEDSVRYDKLASVLERRLEFERDDAVLQQLRLRLAEITGSQLGDAARAYTALEAAFLQQPQDVELWDRLAAAANEADQHLALAHAFARPLDSDALSEADRIELSRRVARLYDDLLDKPEEAEPFHKRVLSVEPLDDTAFFALKHLWTDQERWEDLQAMYRRRIQETSDANDKLDLLLQTCFLYEEILERPELAIDAYREILELSPDHGPTLRNLERLYEQTQRFRDLAELLRGNLDRTEGPDQIDIMFRLGQLHEGKLGEPEQAADCYEAVLTQQPTHLRSQQALAALLSVESLRQRVAGVLEPIYESQGAWRELCEVLTIQLDRGRSDGEQVDLLLRVGELYEQRLRDAEGAFTTYARVVEADAADERGREALARVASNREVFRRRRAEVLTRAVDAVSGDPRLSAELLVELAELLGGVLADRDAAERVYERLIEIDPEDVDNVLLACQALDRIQSEKGDSARLVQVLERQVAIDPDELRQRELLARLSELYEHALSQPQQAIETNRRRLSLDEHDRDAMERLERLYEQAGRWSDLADTLKQRVELVDDDATRKRLQLRIGQLFEERLDAPERAIEVYADILSIFGPDKAVLQSVCQLYERGERWTELLDALTQLEACEDDPTARADLRYQMAELMRSRTDEPARAVELCEAALLEQPEHEGVLGTLDALMAHPDADVRRDAARVAAPRHEGAGNYVKLLSVLEVLAGSDDPSEKLLSLRRAAEVANTGLGEAGQAFEFLGRAIEVGLDSGDLGLMLEDYAQMAEEAGRWNEYVALLRRVVGDVFDSEVQQYILQRVAEVARQKLSDAALAREYYNKLLVERPEDQKTLVELEKLAEEAGDFPALIEVLRRRAELAGKPADRHALMRRQADFHERIDQGAEAIAVLEDVVAEAPSPAVFEALERLYAAAGRYEDLANCYEQQLSLTGVKAADVRYRLARTCHHHLNDTPRALEHLRDAITDDLSHQASIDLLERMMNQPGEYRSQAAEILEPSYLARMEWAKLTGCLEAQLEDETDESTRKRLLTRLAQIYEDQLEDYDGTFELYSRLFREDARDDDVWEKLTRLARVNDDWPRLAKTFANEVKKQGVTDEQMARLAKLTGDIFDERIGNLVKAGEMFAPALAFDPRDQVAFCALESVYERGGKHPDLLELYASQADAAEDDERRVELKHKRAHLLAEGLGDAEGAMAELRSILDILPDDAEAAVTLDAMLVAAKDYPALAEHLRRRIDQALGTPDEVGLKLRLSDLLREHLDDLSGAIDVLDEITQADPGEREALARLEGLVQGEGHRLRLTEILEPIYQHLDQWKKLIAIYEAQVELIEDPGERVALLCRVAELHRDRGRDLGLAMHAFGRAMLIEPDNDDVRTQVDQLAAQLGAWDEHVQAYEDALKHTEDPATIATLLLTIARVQDEKRGDPRKAIDAYERMLAHDAEDPTPLDPLEGLQTMVGDWPGLIRVLERKAELALDLVERTELLRRIASVYEDLMSDPEKAVETYRRALAEDDADLLAWEALDRLYTNASEAEPLAEVLARRLDLASDPADRVTLGLRLGALRHHHLHQLDEATEAYRRVLDDDPHNASAIAELARLYERQGLWPELLDNLSLQASQLDDPGERADLYCRMAVLLERELNDMPEAVARYRDALSEAPSHPAAIDALMRLSAHDGLRTDISALLDPLLRSSERWDDLIQLGQQAVATLADPIERRDELVRIAELHEQGRGDLDSAFTSYGRALSEAPADEALQDAIERLAAQLPDWTRAYDQFFDQAGRTPDPVEASALFRRAGRIAEQELSDDVRAMAAFVVASERDDDATETLVDLDRLYVRNERWEQLLEVLERRVAASGDPHERSELLLRLGGLREQRFQDPDGAFVAYREVLEGDATDARALAGMQGLGQHPHLARDVLDILDDSYRQLGDLRKVVELYDIRVTLAETDGDRIQLLTEAARIWETDLSDPAEAMRVTQRAFGIDPGDDGLLVEIERLAQDGGQLEALRGLIEGLSGADRVDVHRRQELLLRAAEWYRDWFQDAAAEENVLRMVLAEEPQRSEVQQRLLELVRIPGREADTVAALCVWARFEPDSHTRAALLREAATLAEGALSDIMTAGDCYEGVLEAEPDDVAALDELIRIRDAQERYADVAPLLARRLDRTLDVTERVALRYREAALYGGPLVDPERAMATYQQILDEAPEEADAAQALAGLLEAAGRHGELQAVLERRLAIADDPGERMGLRVRLAALSEAQFGDRDGAIARLQEIMLEDPRHALAGHELERLLRAGERFAELSELLLQRAGLASADGDSAGQVGALRELARVCEERLGDSAAACEVLDQLVAIDGRDTEALAALVRLHRAAERWSDAAVYAEQWLVQRDGEALVEGTLELADLFEARLEAPERAEAVLLGGLERVSDARLRTALQGLYERNGDYQRLAELLAEDARADLPEDAKLALLKRIAAIHQDKLSTPGAAVPYLEEATRLRPDDRDVLLALCDLYIGAGRQTDAIPVLEKIIESYGGRRAKEVAVYQHRLGRALEGMGRVDEAFDRFDAAFKIDLTNVHILRDLGRVCMVRGDYDRAQKTYRALLLQKLGTEAGITKADVYFHLGEVSFHQGDATKAKAMLQRAVSEAGEYPAAQALLDQL